MKRVTPIAIGNKSDLDIAAVNLAYAFDPETEQNIFSKAVFVVVEGEVIDDKWVQRDQIVKEGDLKTLEVEIVETASLLRELLLAHYVGKQNIATVEKPVKLTAIGAEAEVVEPDKNPK